MRFDEIFNSLVKRASGSAKLDMEALVESAINAGMSPKAVETRLLKDLREGGPIFGKFMRSLAGATEAAAQAAYRQSLAISGAEARAQLSRLEAIADAEFALDELDPEGMADAEEAATEDVQFTWVAELVNTCHVCLPLHGQSMTLPEWREEGFDPATIHQKEGFNSLCHCRWVETSQLGPRAETIGPLVRVAVKTETGLRLSRKTAKAVMQSDLDRALKAAEKALGSSIGRRTMREMGRSG